MGDAVGYKRATGLNSRESVNRMTAERVLMGLLLGGVAIGCVLVLYPFISALLWAAIATVRMFLGQRHPEAFRLFLVMWRTHIRPGRSR